MKVGEVIDGKYMLVREIGVGGMGAVWEAKALLDDRRVAIKSLHERLVEERELTERFLREARAALEARFSGHVIEVIEVVSGRGRPPYLVMEYLEGEDLSKILERQSSLEIGRAVDLVSQTCEALDEVHRRGIIHRDIKPDNLFVTRLPDGSEWIKLLDFGVAKFSPDSPRKGYSLTKFGYTLGTPDYMAPEQSLGTVKIDYRIDIYSTGVVLYQLLAGQLPYSSANVQELMIRSVRGNPTPLRKIRKEIPAGLEKVVAKAMAVEREDRYQTMFELAAALQPFSTKAPAKGRGLGGLSAGTTVKEKLPSGVGRSPVPDDEQITIQRNLDAGALGISAPATVVDSAEPATFRETAPPRQEPATVAADDPGAVVRSEVLMVGAPVGGGEAPRDAASTGAAGAVAAATPRRRPLRGRWFLWLTIGLAGALVAAAAAIAISIASGGGDARREGGDAEPAKVVTTTTTDAAPRRDAEAQLAADADLPPPGTDAAAPDAAADADASAPDAAADAESDLESDGERDGAADAAPAARPGPGGTRQPPTKTARGTPQGAVAQALRALEPSVRRCLARTSVPGRRVAVTFRVSPDGEVAARRIRPGLSRGVERCLHRAAATVRLQPTGQPARQYTLSYATPP
jgi:serine/threonine-protein kinase